MITNVGEESEMANVNINVWFRCNARCIFCVVGITDRMPSPDKTMSLCHVGRQLARFRDRGATTVTFSGGEPTTYPHLQQAASLAKRLGYEHIEIKTNGIRLADRAFTRVLIDSGVDSFSVSLHGPSSEVHDALVGVRGAYAKALCGLENIRNAGGTFTIPTCIQAANYRLLPEIVKSVLALQPKFCLPTFIEPSGSAEFRFDELVP
jgi:MoaA/NifB/PqqE/SkfB family radical SAM enzyme